MASDAQLTITFPGGMRVDAEYGGMTIPTDQPKDNGGDDSAPAPYSLFLASIGTCAGIYILSFCQRRGIDTGGIKLTQRMEFDPTSHALSRVFLEIHVPASFPEKYRATLVRAADGCAVKKVLQSPPSVDVRTVVD